MTTTAPRPEWVHVHGRKQHVRNWAEAYGEIVDQALVHHVPLPPEWFVTSPPFSYGPRTERMCIYGQWLVMKIPSEKKVARVHQCATILRANGITDVRITYKGGTTRDLPHDPKDAPPPPATQEDVLRAARDLPLDKLALDAGTPAEQRALDTFRDALRSWVQVHAPPA